MRSGDGSSPRKWGKCPYKRVHSVRAWIIPTGVGKTSAPCAVSPLAAVHPHGRGELASKQRTLPETPVHPHGRGENAQSAPEYAMIVGSSPRAWGKRGRTAHSGGEVRFIPTGVGKTQIQVRQCRNSVVHPHGRGENFSARRFFHSTNGSSPRAWGKLLTQTGLFKDVRLIPTGVGKLDVAPFAALQDRSIPTSVGNMVSVPTVQSGPLVHPHGHGEVLTVLYFKEHQLAFAGQSNHTSFSARGANSRDSKSRGMSG